MCKTAAFVAVILSVLLSAGTVQAGDPYRIILTRVDAHDFPTIRLVCSVVDSSGKAVPGLRPQDLLVREGNAVPPTSVTLASVVSPVALALVVDTSGSMAGRPLADAKAAMRTMISALGASDRVGLLSFNAAVQVAQPLTTDKSAALAAIDTLAAGGNTAIYDAVAAGADMLASVDPTMRRAIVLLTDGVDNSSQRPPSSVVSRLTGDELPVFAIGLGNDIDRQTLDVLAGAAVGGAVFIAPTSAQLAEIYAGLSQQLLTEYSVVYRSAQTDLTAGSIVVFEVTVWHGADVLGRIVSSFVIPAGYSPPALAPVATTPPKPAAIASPLAPAPPKNTWVVGLLGAMTALMLVLWLNELTLNLGSGSRRRLQALISGVDVQAERGGRRHLLSRVAGPLHSLGHGLERVLPAGYLEQTRKRLELAGEPIGVAEFIALRVVMTVGLCALLGAIVLIVTHGAGPTFIGAAVGAAAGYSIPGIAISSIKRSRKSAIQRALIPSLDMLALSAEAGLAFDGAITQVVQRWKNPLSDELRRLLVEFQMGRERKQALRELARRADIPDLGKFVNAVIQADTLGVGLAKVLQDQALELRTKRRQRAEEQARLAPVKMMFPMVLLIFPALFVVILGPAVPKLTAIFNLGP
jgi:tight adherence protein C